MSCVHPAREPTECGSASGKMSLPGASMVDVTEPQPEPQSETFDSAIIVTHLDGTEERFPVKITTHAPPAEKETR